MEKFSVRRQALPLALLAIPVAVNAQAGDPRPNVVLVLADDMGYSGVTCFGGWGLETPNIDALAASGVVCTNFHAAPVSSATRVTLMTGLYQQRVGLNGIYSATDVNDGLDPQAHPSFVKDLQSSGYETALYGKWHLGLGPQFNPNLHGFGDFRGFLIGNIDLVSHRDRFNKVDWWHNGEPEDEPGEYATELINRHSVEFIHKAAGKSPFFLMVSHGAVHVPILGPDDPAVRNGEDLCINRNDLDMETGEYQRRFRSMVKLIDDGVGQIMAALKEEGVLDNTLVIFLSDNGGEEICEEKYPGINGGFHGWKGTAYEGGTRVPAIFSLPSVLRHSVRGDLMNTMDVMPTVMELCGLSDRIGDIDGVSLVPTLAKGRRMPARKVFCSNSGYLSLTDGDWKLVWDRNGTELYRISKDRYEKKDLLGKYPERGASMKAEINQWWQECTAGTALEGTDPIPPAPKKKKEK